jgi:protein-S-isoprenylcysteine O-methyltransferase Ste14
MPSVPPGSPVTFASPAEIPKSTAGVIAPPPLIYLVPLIGTLFLRHWYPVRIVGPHAAAPVGIACLLLGLAAHLSAVLTLRRAKTSPKPWLPTTAVVTAGPYRFTRNPIYVGFSLIYIGVGFWANTLWPFLVLPFILLVMQFGVVAREEVYLQRIFGDQYLEYKRRVRRWL